MRPASRQQYFRDVFTRFYSLDNYFEVAKRWILVWTGQLQDWKSGHLDSASGKSSDLSRDLESLLLTSEADNAELTWLHYLISYFGNYKEIRACEEFSLWLIHCLIQQMAIFLDYVQNPLVNLETKNRINRTKDRLFGKLFFLFSWSGMKPFAPSLSHHGLSFCQAWRWRHYHQLSGLSGAISLTTAIQPQSWHYYFLGQGHIKWLGRRSLPPDVSH